MGTAGVRRHDGHCTAHVVAYCTDVLSCPDVKQNESRRGRLVHCAQHVARLQDVRLRCRSAYMYNLPEQQQRQAIP